ncbi:neoverrucotoxin subunit alpha-like [Fundulus heteroclitus]|uniref:neoverrucotoxin subunit alpha-like n=1 Tax=Fundulus heteroclitus TaxID=8078 RepID=UPI00165BEA8D|nr:neoverrucotoxin subunit alpha-like [Fundulus heteroclitus]
MSKGDGTAYREEVETLTFSLDNNLALNTMKTIQIILDFRRNRLSLSLMDISTTKRLSRACNTTKDNSCSLTVDLDTVNKHLKLSEDHRNVTRVEEEQPYPDHPDRFYCLYQLLCTDSLTGRCYWEVEWSGRVDIAVSYRGIKRKGDSDNSWFGFNEKSWSLICSDDGYSVWHDHKTVQIPFSSSSPSVSDRVAVYVDYPAGILTFYRVSSDALIHLYTFNTTFTEPLYPGFGFEFRDHSRDAWCSF